MCSKAQAYWLIKYVFPIENLENEVKRRRVKFLVEEKIEEK